jgi:DNA uptake protein ComE-like DNA-binding protein
MKLTYTETVQAQKLISNKEKREFERKNKYPVKRKLKRPPARFDPNSYSAEEWMQLGLSQKQTEVVLKFTKRGIYSNEDLQKIFVIPEALFLLIKDSTVYPLRPKYSNEIKDETKAFPNKDTDRNKTILVELNTADQTELESIPGVGQFFAKMILKKRTELGGFASKDQLLEVYKMDKEKLDAIEKYVRVNPDIIIPLNINTASFEELYKHPYINSKVANSIVKMREQKGGYKSVDELKESLLIDRELFLKLKPYVYL